MESLHKLENQVASLFKDLPKLPDDIKEVVIKIQPILALIFGILQLLAAWGLWGLANWTENVSQYASQLSYYAGGAYGGLTVMDKTVIYGGIAVLLIDAVILLMAVGPLNKRAKRGWDLLFLAALINLIYGVVTVFIDGRGIGGLIMSLIGTAIGLYILFQIRDKYGKKSHKPESLEHHKK